MWINKQAYVHLIELNQIAIRDLAQRLDRTERQAIDREATIERFRGEADRARVEAAAAKAYSDVWRLQVNTLTSQNAALLTRLVPGLNVVTPIVQHDPILVPAIDFDDMGDAAAAAYTGAPLRSDGTEIPADPGLVPGDTSMFLDPEEGLEGARGTVVTSQPGV